MPNFSAEFIRAEGDEEDDADEEGKACCDDEEGCELVVVSQPIVGPNSILCVILTVDIIMVLLVEDMASGSH